MTTSNTIKEEVVAPTSLAETIEVARSVLQGFTQTETCLQHMSEVAKSFGETQLKIDEKVDSIFKLLTQWNSSNKFGSSQKAPIFFNPPSTPPSQLTETHTLLTPEDLAFRRKQEVGGKIFLHHETLIPPNTNNPPPPIPTHKILPQKRPSYYTSTWVYLQ
jgi:hypothetical protein